MRISRMLPTVLLTGTAEILFVKLNPVAVYDGEVFFPDTALPASTVKYLNKFHPDVPRTRVSETDFTWYCASTLMRQLRTQLRRKDDPASDT